MEEKVFDKKLKYRTKVVSYLEVGTKSVLEDIFEIQGQTAVVWL